MADQDNAACDVAEHLGIRLSVPYTYVSGNGRPKPRARSLFAKAPAREALSLEGRKGERVLGR